MRTHRQVQLPGSQASAPALHGPWSLPTSGVPVRSCPALAQVESAYARQRLRRADALIALDCLALWSLVKYKEELSQISLVLSACAVYC